MEMRNKKEVVKIIEKIDLKVSKIQEAMLSNDIDKIRDVMIYEAYKLGYEDRRKVGER